MAPRRSEDPAVPGKKPTVTWALFQTICDNLAACGLKVKACELAGVSYESVINAVKEQTLAGDDEWQEAWEAANERYKELVVAEVHRRAIDGVDEPVFGSLGTGMGTGEVGTVRKYSDAMLALLAKAKVPEFTERVDHSHTFRAEGVPEILSDLSLKAKKAIREIILQDNRERREAAEARAALQAGAIEGEAILLEDGRG